MYILVAIFERDKNCRATIVRVCASVVQHSHYRTTLASNLAIHRATKQSRAPLLRLHASVYNVARRSYNRSYEPEPENRSHPIASEFCACSKFRRDSLRSKICLQQVRLVVQQKRPLARTCAIVIAKCCKEVVQQL